VYDDGEVVERSRTLQAWLSCPVVRLMTPATVDEHVAAVARQLGAPRSSGETPTRLQQPRSKLRTTDDAAPISTSYILGIV
jgi:hypothetical protein